MPISYSYNRPPFSCCRWWHRPRHDRDGGWRQQQAEALSSALQASSASAQHHEHVGDVSSAKVGLCFCPWYGLVYYIPIEGPCFCRLLQVILATVSLLSIPVPLKYIQDMSHALTVIPCGTHMAPQVQELAAQQVAEMRALEALSATLRHWREYT